MDRDKTRITAKRLKRKLMPKLKLSLACTQTDRSAPILDGRIKIEGCDVTPLPGQTQDIFRRVLNDRAFDIAEMSMCSHIIQVGLDVQDYVAIPVFLSRSFRHSSIYIRTDRGIDRPENLAGRTIGLEQYQQTVGLWARGILGDEYGVKTQNVNWMNGGLEQPGGGERVALKLPATIRLNAILKNETLDNMLTEGALDAVISTRPPPCFQKGHPKVSRLFPNYRAAEIEYFHKTKAFPIMHCVVIRRRLIDEHPWLPVEVFRAFVKAKAYALKELTLVNILRISSAWVAEDTAETKRILGDSMWAYGFKESRHEIETMLRYAQNDGLIARAVTPEDIFHPSTHILADKV
jgi:4,5-dihydroxyphthalate decarboxylase